jgi:putative heme transporter
MTGADAAAESDAAGRPVTVDFSTRTLLSAVVVIVLALGVFAAFRTGVDALTKIGIGLVLAVALNPLVAAVERRGPSRRSAAAIVGAIFALGAVVFVFLIGPATIEQAQNFEEELPETIEGFYELPLVGSWLSENDARDKVDEFIADLPTKIDNDSIADLANSLVGGAVSTAIVLVVAFAVMIDGVRLVNLVRSLIPERHRPAADHYARVLYDTFGNYFGGSLTVAAMMGLYVLVIGLVFGVPLAPIAAVWAMFTDLVPQIGGFLGGAFLTLLALSESVPTALIVGALFVIYMNFENHVIQPTIIGEAVDLTPPATMMAALVGGAAGGVPGALVATPLVGAGKRLYLELRYPGEHRGASEREGFVQRLRSLFGRGDSNDD